MRDHLITGLALAGVAENLKGYEKSGIFGLYQVSSRVAFKISEKFMGFPFYDLTHLVSDLGGFPPTFPTIEFLFLGWKNSQFHGIPVQSGSACPASQGDGFVQTIRMDLCRP